MLVGEEPMSSEYSALEYVWAASSLSKPLKFSHAPPGRSARDSDSWAEGLRHGMNRSL